MTDETPTIRHADCHPCSLLPASRPQGMPGAEELMSALEATVDPWAERPRELSAERMSAAAARCAAADAIAWHQALHVVELCRRVAELAARRCGPVG